MAAREEAFDRGDAPFGQRCMTHTRVETLGIVVQSDVSVCHARNVSSEQAPTRKIDDACTGRNLAMMIVGGAGLILGSIIGGDTGTIIMMGGGALGLYGMWQFLK